MKGLYLLLVFIFLGTSWGFIPGLEVGPKSLLRLALCVLFLLNLYLYKCLHRFFFPAIKKQSTSGKFYPSTNSAATLHYVSRILGLAIIFSHLTITLSGAQSFIVPIAKTALIFISYLITLSVAEHISLYYFTYADEVGKKRKLILWRDPPRPIPCRCLCSQASFCPLPPQLLSLSSSVGLRYCGPWPEHEALPLLLSHLSFNHLVSVKNMAVAVSYTGYLFGCAFLINSILLPISSENHPTPFSSQDLR